VNPPSAAGAWSLAGADWLSSTYAHRFLLSKFDRHFCQAMHPIRIICDCRRENNILKTVCSREHKALALIMAGVRCIVGDEEPSFAELESLPVLAPCRGGRFSWAATGRGRSERGGMAEA
jgi:hypothetical protein